MLQMHLESRFVESWTCGFKLIALLTSLKRSWYFLIDLTSNKICKSIVKITIFLISLNAACVFCRSKLIHRLLFWEMYSYFKGENLIAMKFSCDIQKPSIAFVLDSSRCFTTKENTIIGIYQNVDPKRQSHSLWIFEPSLFLMSPLLGSFENE